MTDAVIRTGVPTRKPASPVTEALKDVAVTTVLIFLLSIYMVGFKTQANQGQQLTFATNLMDVFWACILVPAGRFLVALNRQGIPKPALIGGLLSFVYLFG